jgi:hypothetical protein
VSGLTTVTGSAVTVAAGFVDTGTASCTGGKVVVGGGVSTSDITLFGLVESFPSNSTTWTGSGFDGGSSGSITFTVYAICSNP